MWPFRRNRDLEHVLGKDLLKALDDRRPIPVEARRGSISSLVVEVSADDVDNLARDLSSAFDIVTGNRGHVVAIFGPFLFATFGFPFEKDVPDTRGSLANVVSELGRNLGSRGKVVVMESEGLFCMIGSKMGRYSPVFRSGAESMRSLLSIEFGSTKNLDRGD